MQRRIGGGGPDCSIFLRLRIGGRKAAAQLARLSLSATLGRGKIVTNPKLHAGPPCRSVRPLGIANHNRSYQINPSQRLTLHLAQFSGPAHGELRFQRVHQAHQLLHFGHDPALFGSMHEEI